MHEFPHIYVDFQVNSGPFVDFYKYLEFGEYQHESLDGLQKVEAFPKKFSKPKVGTIYRYKTIELSDRFRALLKNASSAVNTIYRSTDTLEYLKQGDVIGVDQSEDYEGNQVLIKITNKCKI